MWRVWAKSLGPKDGANEKEADIIALTRTLILFSYIVTNAFIIANALHNFSQPRIQPAVSCNKPGTVP